MQPIVNGVTGLNGHLVLSLAEEEHNEGQEKLQNMPNLGARNVVEANGPAALVIQKNVLEVQY